MQRRPGLAVGLALVGMVSNLAPLAADCRGSAAPAATLLFPYFEVDLANPSGRTTLIAIGNARGDAPVLAHVVVWTNRGLPTLSFDLHLEADDVETINLRDIFFAGSLPVTGGAGFPTCTDPLTNPALGEPGRALLRQQHTGQPVAPSDRCWSSPAGADLASGFITVDAANGCSATVRIPGDEGYFVDDGSGIAGLSNVLYGDFFLADSGQNSAQGFEAVHLPADAGRYGHGLLPTFYSSGAESRADHRAPLASAYRTRYLNGGPFDGGTDLVLWLSYPGWLDGEPIECAYTNGGLCRQLAVQRFDEAGGQSEPLILHDGEFGGPVVTRLAVGEEILPVSTPFGLIDVRNQDVIGCVITPVGTEPLQMNLLPLHSAEARYSVGLNAIATESFCDSPPTAAPRLAAPGASPSGRGQER